MLLPPSTTMQAPLSRTTDGTPRGSTPPAVSFLVYSGTRSTPCECTPRTSALTSEPLRYAASSARMPQCTKISVTRASSSSARTRRSVVTIVSAFQSGARDALDDVPLRQQEYDRDGQDAERGRGHLQRILRRAIEVRELVERNGQRDELRST